MKKLLVTVVLLITMCSGCASVKSAQRFKKGRIEKGHIASEVEKIINAADPHVNIGIKISSLQSNEIIFQKNADRHFIPASTLKLLTLASALHYLGPSYRFNTVLWTDGFSAKAGVIKNLFIQGNGDPSLMDHHLISLADELKQLGIKEISGHVYVDDQVFDNVLWVRGAMWDDRRFGYSAPVAGLNLNYNRLLIKTLPAHKTGALAHAIVSPPSSFIEVHSRAQTLNDRAKRQLTLSVERGKHREEEWPSTANDGLRQGDKVFVNGQTTRSSDPYYSLLAVNDPGMFAGTFFKDQLTKIGIKVHGKVARMVTPATAVRLACHESRSLAEALIDFTKISNNVANDALVKAIAAQSGVKPATFSAGLKLINEFLTKEVGIEPGSLITADGAGGSRYNLITPEQMVKLLTYAANHFHMGPEFMAALPIAGEDGTLGSRLTSDHLRHNIRAKTGAMTGVTGLAGYLTGDDGKRYAFAIMINGFIGNTSKYTRLQDDILATMLRDDEAQVANVK